VDNAAIERLLVKLLERPRPLRELMPGAGRDVLVRVADYLKTAGLAGVRTEHGALVASISETGRAYVERARRGPG
jgi:hypothetical protein